MIQSVLLIARIASRPIRLRRRCAQARESTAIRRPARVPALLAHDADLATALAPTLSVTRGVPASDRSPRLVA